VNFLRCLALQEKKLDDSPRLDVVAIARELVSFLVGLRTYHHPGNFYLRRLHVSPAE